MTAFGVLLTVGGVLLVVGQLVYAVTRGKPSHDHEEQ